MHFGRPLPMRQLGGCTPGTHRSGIGVRRQLLLRRDGRRGGRHMRVEPAELSVATALPSLQCQWPRP